MSFAGLLASAQPLDGGPSAPLGTGFALAVPQDWLQGRTAYGGFSAALALDAARRAGGEGLPPLRSATVSFIGPLYGEIEVRARVQRRGKNATWMAAEVLRDGEVGLTASFVFMGPVDSALHLNERPLPHGIIPVDEAELFAPNAHAPAFRSNVEVRFALPRAEDKRPELCWWMRLADRTGLDPMTEVLLMADGLPPGVLPLLNPGVPVSSMTWLANLLTPAPQTRDGWWLLRSTGDYAEAGCSSQRMEIWNTDGQPVMVGMQSVAVFG